MRYRLTKPMRRWASALIAALYVLGVVAPAAAFAHADRDAVVHVLDESHGGTLTLHFHPDNGPHEDNGKTGKAAHQCCGISALAGLVPPSGLAAVVRLARQAPVDRAARPLTGLASARLDRPPR